MEGRERERETPKLSPIKGTAPALIPRKFMASSKLDGQTANLRVRVKVKVRVRVRVRVSVRVTVSVSVKDRVRVGIRDRDRARVRVKGGVKGRVKGRVRVMHLCHGGFAGYRECVGRI